MPRKPWEHRGAGADKRLRGRKAVEQRNRRLARTNYLCEHCLPRYVPATVVDHIIPLAKGGDDTDANTRNLCGPCHDKVTAEQFGYRKKLRFGADGWPVS